MPQKRRRSSKSTKAQNEALINTQLVVSDLPVIVELEKDYSFNAEVFISMFSGQINDVLSSHDDARPEFSPTEKGELAGDNPSEAARKNLSTFIHLLPHLATVTAKKQGRRRSREHIQFVDNSASAGEGAAAQPDFGFKLVGPKNGGSDWILPGKLVPDGDEFRSPQFHVEGTIFTSFRPTVRSAVAEALRETAALALAGNNPWAFTCSGHELVLLRFYKIEPRWRRPEHADKVQLGAFYYPVPALPVAGAASAAATWEHRELFALPWYRDAPQEHRRPLSYHLGIWVALMARLCTPDEPVSTGIPAELDSWHWGFDIHEGRAYEAHYSTAVRRSFNIMDWDTRPYSVFTARRKATYSDHDRICPAMAESMRWRPDSPSEGSEGEEGAQGRPRRKMRCRYVHKGGCAQIFHDYEFGP